MIYRKTMSFILILGVTFSLSFISDVFSQNEGEQINEYIEEKNSVEKYEVDETTEVPYDVDETTNKAIDEEEIENTE